MRYDFDYDAFVGLDEASVPAADRARSLAQCNVQALAADGQHGLWIGTAQQGLSVLSLDAQGRMRSLRQPALPGGAAVNSLAVDDEQQVWGSINRAGLLVVRA